MITYHDHRELEATFQVDLQAAIPVPRGKQAEHALWFDDLFVNAGNRPGP